MVGQRRLREIEECAKELHDAVHELLDAAGYPGRDRVLEAAGDLQPRLDWLLGGRELESTLARARHLLEHGVRVVEHLLDIVEHEPEGQDLARGWVTRVAEFRERAT